MFGSIGSVEILWCPCAAPGWCWNDHHREMDLICRSRATPLTPSLGRISGEVSEPKLEITTTTAREFGGGSITGRGDEIESQ